MQGANLSKGWHDIKDEKGVWRLGKEIGNISQDVIQVRLDGWSSKYDSIYCLHSKNVAPPRAHTRGYTTQQPYPLRQILEDDKQASFLKVKLNLLLNSDLSLMNPIQTNLFFSVELFTMFDTILTLPFDHKQIKQALEITKFFINIVNLATKILQHSTVYMQTVKTNPNNKAIHKSSYQIFLMLRGALGLNPRYKKFFDHPDNQYTKSTNNVDVLLKSNDEGLLLFNTYLKNIITHNLNSEEDFLTSGEVVSILLELYEKQLISQQYSTHLKIILDTLSSYFKCMCKNKELFKYLTQNANGKYLVNMFENMHLKLKPTKKFIQVKQMKQKQIKKQDLRKTPEIQSKPSNLMRTMDFDDKRINGIEQRLLKMEKQMIAKNTNQQVDILNKFFQEKQKELQSRQFAKIPDSDYDFNEVSFLNALQLLLSNNQQQKANKLISWRRKIIQLSTLAGWDVARSVAKNTQHKLEVDTKDILSCNIDYLKKMYSL